MKKRTSLILAIVFFALAALALSGLISEANADEPLTVIGKATIPAGTKLMAALPFDGDTLMPFLFRSAESQVLYIISRFEAILDAQDMMIPGGYILDMSGARHSCPAHGMETMNAGMIGISDIDIESLGIEIMIFSNNL